MSGTLHSPARFKQRISIKILGIIINKLLNWIDHAKYIKHKVGKKGKEIRRMTSSKWGLSPAAIKRLYLAGFERSLVYGAKVWWGDKESKSALTKILRTAQRPFALAICRGYNTLSTDAALLLSGIMPIELVLNVESGMASLNRPRDVFEVSNSEDVIDVAPQKIFCNPADQREINFVKETPSGEGLIVFTDGSKSENGVGAGWCAFNKNGLICEGSYVMNYYNSVFQAENLAIYMALDWFEHENYNEIHIASDSLSSLEALSSPYMKSWSTMRSKLKIHELKKKIKKFSYIG
ncbi:RBFOX2 [Cordylochernes scorpioides]|uniref:RBFOX2 n=1 Tax=Cordylochernes scorpioides TaxID=51811 RepID=A0ABY6JV08_9ARAC|nr:RBFOX2 [Cordylochernes scorpioides]